MVDSASVQLRKRGRWVILLSSYVNDVLLDGVLFSLGTLFLDMMNTFHTNRAQTAVVQSTLFGVVLCGGVVSGVIVGRIGPRLAGLCGAVTFTLGMGASFFAMSLAYLIVTVGVFAAVGIITLYISCTTMISMYFTGKQRVIALAFFTSGSGIGGMALTYTIDHFRIPFGLRGTFLMLCGLVMHSIPSILLWRVVQPISLVTLEYKASQENRKRDNLHNEEMFINESACAHKFQTALKEVTASAHSNTAAVIQSTRDGSGTTARNPSRCAETAKFLHQIRRRSAPNIHVPETDQEATMERHVLKRLKHVIGIIPFLLFSIACAFVYAPAIQLPIFVFDIFVDKGLSDSDGSLGLILLNACNIFGRLIAGSITTIPKVPALAVPLLSPITGLTAAVLLLYGNSLVVMCTACCLTGLSIGVLVSCASFTTVALLDHESYIPEAVGFVLTTMGIANIGFGPLVGFIRDQTGTYTMSFLCVAVAMATGMVINVAALCVHCKQHRYRNAERVANDSTAGTLQRGVGNFGFHFNDEE